jgi:hypothetical protein
LIRTALATLQRILETHYVVPPVEDRLMLVKRPDELPAKLALAIDFSKLAATADAAPDAAAA